LEKTVPPDYLFKYMPLRDPSDQTRDKRLAALLTNSQLWFSSPADFNDPMDCKPRFRFDGGTPQKIEEFRRTAIAAMVQHDCPNATLEERRARVLEYVKMYPTVDEAFFERAHTVLSADLQRLVGVLCLSECERDPVMFYHYGDKHRGMCLKFRSGAFFEHAEPVEYSADFPVIDFFDERDHEAQFKRIFLTKYDGWKYEREHRVVNFTQDPDGRLTDYPSELLEGVIFGYLMPQEDRDYATELLKQRGSPVTLYEATLGREQYLLDIVPIS
jgi:hypothetical protein